jgi:hypothetical protein
MLRLSKHERKGLPACFDATQHDTSLFLWDAEINSA